MIRKSIALLTAVLITVSMFPAAVYASGADPEEGQEEYAEEWEWHDFEEENEKTEGLTPEGNLTLVDDYGDAPEAGQQFITLVTKNGYYFYLVIDRDKDGKETVHFLNLVDENDLFELLEDDEKDAYEAKIEAEQAAKEAAEKAAAEAAAAETEEPVQPQKEKKHINILPVFLVALLMAVGIGGWLVIQAKKKKKTEDAPDPDADYEVFSDDYEDVEEGSEDETEEWEDEEDENDDDQ